MKKRLLLSLIMLCTVAALFGVNHASAYYYSGSYGDLSYEVEDGAVTITDCNTSATAVEIPAEINGYPVTSIKWSAFSGCESLTSITIPDSVTSIGSNAFQYCNSLTSVYTPSLEAWLGISFEYCASTPLSYGANLYVDGKLLTDLVIPNSVTTIGGFAFYERTALTSITIPDGVTSIGESAFSDCYALTSITIPSGIISIEKKAFRGCTGLTSVTIPSSVIAIYESAFSGCSKLSKVYYSGTEAEWNEIVVKSGNDCLLNARLIASDSSTPGDIDGDEEVTVFDAIYLFNHAMFPDLYPVDANRVTDYNGDGEFDMNDAIYLFNHTMFPDLYPI